MRPLIALLILPLSFSPTAALASGTLSCTIEHPSLEMNFEGVVGHGLGEQLTEVRGETTIKSPMITSDLKAMTLAREDVTQFWFYGRDLKLRLYRDSTKEPGESLELTLEGTGKGDDGMSYSSVFKATLSKLEAGATEAKTLTIKGKATCSSE